jgi:hypothetical protein
VKAHIWKDRQTGMWFFDIHGLAGCAAWYGKRPTWEQALSEVLAGLDLDRAVRS